MHPYSYKQPVNMILVLLQYLFNIFCSEDIWVLHHHNTDMYNQLCMYNRLHMFPPYPNFIHFEKLLLDNRTKDYALYIYIYTCIYTTYNHIYIYIYIYIYTYTYRYIRLYMFNKYIYIDIVSVCMFICIIYILYM